MERIELTKKEYTNLYDFFKDCYIEESIIIQFFKRNAMCLTVDNSEALFLKLLLEKSIKDKDNVYLNKIIKKIDKMLNDKTLLGYNEY